MKKVTISNILDQYESHLTSEQITAIKALNPMVRQSGDEAKLTIKKDYTKGWIKLKNKLQTN